MLVRIDESAPEPLYAQIAAQLRGAIARGEIRTGERLAPARELGQSLAVNVHTVLRAYAVLRDEALVEMRRGRGVTVLGAAAARADVAELAHRLVTEALRVGLSRREVLALVERHL